MSGLRLIAAAVLAIAVVTPVPAQEAAAELTLSADAPGRVAAGEIFQVEITARYYGAFDVTLHTEDTEDWSNLTLVSRASADRVYAGQGGRSIKERTFTLYVEATQEGTARLPGLPVTYLLDGEETRQLTPHIKIEVGAETVPLSRRLFWPSVVVMAIVLIAGGGYAAKRALAARRLREQQRPPKAEELLRDQLVALRQARLSGNAQPYFTQAERVLYRYCEMRYGVVHKPGSPDSLVKRLAEAGAGASEVETIEALARRCYDGKFAPVSVTSEELERFEQELLAIVQR